MSDTTSRYAVLEDVADGGNINKIAIEIVGLPYIGKTTIISEMIHQLRTKKIRHHQISEYSGPEYFYESAKLTPDVNIARALSCARELIEKSYDERADIILIDRGIYDSLVWMDWFKDCRNIPDENSKSMEILLDYIVGKFKRYIVVWLDGDPKLSIARHAGLGRIVNPLALEQLRACYLEREHSALLGLHILRISGGLEDRRKSALRILQKLKLIDKCPSQQIER